MTQYEIEISRTAEKQLKSLPKKDQLRLVKSIIALGDDPRPRGSRKLAGYDDVFRIRVGRYRVLYSIDDKHIIVIILKIGHRRDVYR